MVTAELQNECYVFGSVSLVARVMCRSDVAYFDGLSETILSVALVRPKPGMFSRLLAMMNGLCSALCSAVLV